MRLFTLKFRSDQLKVTHMGKTLRLKKCIAVRKHVNQCKTKKCTRQRRYAALSPDIARL